MFGNVIVGIDGEQGGRDALALAKNLVDQGGRLTLANVRPGDAFVRRRGDPGCQPVEQDDPIALLERARREARVEAQLRQIVDSSVVKGLHELAEDAGAGLLVLGSSRCGMVGRVMVGSDGRAALNGAPCAVALAPAGYARQPHAMRAIGVGYDGSKESDHGLVVGRALAASYGAAFEAVTAPAYGQVEEELALRSASLDLLVLGFRDYGPLGRLVHRSTTDRLARCARCPLLVLTRAARKTALPARSWQEVAGVVGYQ